MASERLMRLMEGSSCAAGGFRILPVDIDDVLMLFLCCRFELCSPGSFENGMNSQLKRLMLDHYDFSDRQDRTLGCGYRYGRLENISGRCSEPNGDQNWLLISAFQSS
jgi:hypothetical protein